MPGTKLTVMAIAVLLFAGTVKAEVGKVAAMMGAALIYDEEQSWRAMTGDPVQEENIVETGERSKMKLLFIDGSLLTLDERSGIGIEKFMYSEGKGGTSVFNLLEGAVRVVAGKTDVKIHTQTAVVETKGAILELETGGEGDKLFTTILCFEGEADVRSTEPAIAGIVRLKASYLVTVWESEPLLEPVYVLLDAASEDDNETYINEAPADKEITGDITEIEGVTPEAVLPPVEQQPVVTTPVDINVTFP